MPWGTKKEVKIRETFIYTVCCCDAGDWRVYDGVCHGRAWASAGEGGTRGAGPVERANGVIYVGDSRFNGMEMYFGKGGEFVIAKDSMDYNWLVNQAAYRIAAVKRAHPKVTQ